MSVVFEGCIQEGGEHGPYRRAGCRVHTLGLALQCEYRREGCRVHKVRWVL